MWKGGKIAMIENANDKPQSLLKAESDLEKQNTVLKKRRKKQMRRSVKQTIITRLFGVGL